MQNAQIFCCDVVFLLWCLKASQIFVINACHLRLMFFIQCRFMKEFDWSVKKSPIFLCKKFPTESLSAEQEEYKTKNSFALVC